jgi:two-component system CheB/CheR fusion protein
MNVSNPDAQADREFESLLDYLKHNRGFDFTGYKRSSVERRVNKRMQQLHMDLFSDYLDYLEVHPEEFPQLFNTILINVTAFFRDTAAWAILATEVIPQIVANKGADQPIRVWSAGCASGEEAYTLAIVLAEHLGLEGFRRRVKIYATDVDEEALLQARQASYSAKDLKPVATELRDKYFELAGNRYVFRPDLRRVVIFGRHDLVQAAPISRLDLLVCRNTLMYFNAETQARILARLHFALSDTGFIFLGKAEMLLTHADLFTPVHLKHRVFTKVPKLNLHDRLLVLAQAGHTDAGNHLAGNLRLREMAFDVSQIAQMVLDLQGNLVLANEQVKTLFDLSSRDLGRPFQDLELSYRLVDLRSSIEQVRAKHLPLRLTHVERHFPEAASQYLNVDLIPLMDDHNNLQGVSITFYDVTHHQHLQVELERNKQELETAYEELQSTNEELQTTNEELQSTVEELETTNEELQSTNEELETMNEELQSTNEELQTMNDELRLRTDDLNQSNAFLESILASLRAAAVAVDRNFNILIWNSKASDLWGLRTDEVWGQSLLSLDIGLPVEHLRNPIRAALAERSACEEVVLDATNRRGRAMQCRVTCTPLIGVEQDVQGAILLMEEWDGGGAQSTQNNV